jgi:hypothetical protein
MSAPLLHAPFAEQLELFGSVGSPGIYLPTPEEIEAARTPYGGWTRKQLAQWGGCVAAEARLEAAVDCDGPGPSEGGMSATIIQFPARRQLAIRVEREGPAWCVIRQQYGWLFGSRREALHEALALAQQDDVAVITRGVA